MKKFVIGLSFVAFSVQIFGSGLGGLESFEPKDVHFIGARKRVFNLTHAILYTKATGSFLVTLDPAHNNIIRAGNCESVVDEIEKLDIFYGHQNVVKRYQVGGSQVGMYKGDMSTFVGLVGLAKCTYGNDVVHAPFVHALAQERLSRQQRSAVLYGHEPVSVPQSLPVFVPQSLNAFYAELGEIPPHIGALSRPMPEMTDSEMVAAGLPFPSKMPSPEMRSTPRKLFPSGDGAFRLQ